MKNYKELYLKAISRCSTTNAWEWEKKYAEEILSEVINELIRNYQGDDWHGFNMDIKKLSPLLRD